MELIVSDLDGTLLDRSASISVYTRETLARLTDRGIAYTVATGRTRQGARAILAGHGFNLPQVYKNGVMIWDPRSDRFSHQQILSVSEVECVIAALRAQDVAPFIFTAEHDGGHRVYHPPLQSEVEADLAAEFGVQGASELVPLARLPARCAITHISAVGNPDAIRPVEKAVASEPCLVAHAGTALEGDGL